MFVHGSAFNAKTVVGRLTEKMAKQKAVEVNNKIKINKKMIVGRGRVFFVFTSKS